MCTAGKTSIRHVHQIFSGDIVAGDYVRFLVGTCCSEVLRVALGWLFNSQLPWLIGNVHNIAGVRGLFTPAELQRFYRESPNPLDG